MGCVQPANPDGLGATARRADHERGTGWRPASGTREQFSSEYELCETLGTGSFGMVLSARVRRSGCMEAVKVVDAGSSRRAQVDDAAMARKWKLAMAEVEVWRAVGRHPNVVELRGLFCDSRVVFMVMERCECTVAEKVDANRDLLQSGLPRLLHQMLLGVEACHVASVAHRDIKPANYLIGLDGSTVKLCDFNLSVVLPSNHSLKGGEFGTPPFMSPEMLTARHGIGTDVWSYGVMAYFMLFGELPYIPQEATAGAAKAAIRAGVPVPRYLEKVHRDRSDDSMRFCRDLLQRDASRRCSAGDALGHPYFQTALDAKKDLAMIATQDTLDSLGLDTLESENEKKGSSVMGEHDDWEDGELLGLPASA